MTVCMKLTIIVTEPSVNIIRYKECYRSVGQVFKPIAYFNDLPDDRRCLQTLSVEWSKVEFVHLNIINGSNLDSN